MSFRNTVLRHIKKNIPKQVLEAAFRRPSLSGWYGNFSIDHVLEQKVLYENFLPDMDLYGGVQTSIQLEMSWLHRADDLSYIIRVPKTATNGRSIKHVRGLRMGLNKHNSFSGVSMELNNMYHNSVSPLFQAANSTLNASAGISYIETHHLEVIDENVIHARTGVTITPSLVLDVDLENDINFSNIDPAYYMKFAIACVELCKSIIYNELVVTIEEGELRSGHTIGRIKDIVESYSDAYMNYQDWLTKKGSKLQTLGDLKRSTDHLKSLIPVS